MMRPSIFCICMMIISSLSASTVNAQDKVAGHKNLIVYFSRTENTQVVAEIIQGLVGGTLMQIETKHPYPKDYKATVDQVAKENESGFQPELKTTVSNLDEYSTVYIGFPTWGMQLPPPVKSFLHQHDLTGKTVIPFNTNAGYGVGSGFETVEHLCPKSSVLDGFEIKGGIERDGVMLAIKNIRKQDVERKVKQWLQRINRLPE